MLRADVTADSVHRRQAGCLELKTNFLGTTREGRIRCECVAEHLGRTTHVRSATVFGPDDKRIALFRCTQLILW